MRLQRENAAVAGYLGKLQNMDGTRRGVAGVMEYRLRDDAQRRRHVLQREAGGRDSGRAADHDTDRRQVDECPRGAAEQNCRNDQRRRAGDADDGGEIDGRPRRRHLNVLPRWRSAFRFSVRRHDPLEPRFVPSARPSWRQVVRSVLMISVIVTPSLSSTTTTSPRATRRLLT